MLDSEWNIIDDFPALVEENKKLRKKLKKWKKRALIAEETIERCKPLLGLWIEDMSGEPVDWKIDSYGGLAVNDEIVLMSFTSNSSPGFTE